MDFQDVVRKRRMVRAFEPRPIPPEVVDRILANARRGPSSGFTQGFEFLVFDGPDQTQNLWQYLASQNLDDATGVRNAPLIIVPVANPQAYVRRYLEPDKAQVGRKTAEDWPAPYWYTDSAFAAMLILLTAVDAGLAGFYFSIAPRSEYIPAFMEHFGIPSDRWPIGAIAIGYPARDKPSSSLKRGRRPTNEVLHFDKW